MTSTDRVLPELDPSTAFFWLSGRDGRLRIRRCRDCGHYQHPPSPVCPVCLSRAIEAEPVSGRAKVVSFTVNHQVWRPGLQVPFVVAIVELPEQAGLRLTTNIVGCAPESVEIGLPVELVFEQCEDVWLPLFRPLEAVGEAGSHS